MEIILNNSFLAIKNDELELVNGGRLDDSGFWGNLADLASLLSVLGRNTFIGFVNGMYLSISMQGLNDSINGYNRIY